MSSGYVSESVRQLVREAFGNRCAYCLSSQHYINSKLEIEHILPTARGGGSEELNLCLACRMCNSYKGDQIEAIDTISNIVVSLFNPRTQVWSEHFQWSRDGVRVIGITAVGRATVEALQLNNEIAVNVRRNRVSVGWHPPTS